MNQILTFVRRNKLDVACYLIILVGVLFTAGNLIFDWPDVVGVVAGLTISFTAALIVYLMFRRGLDHRPS